MSDIEVMTPRPGLRRLPGILAKGGIAWETRKARQLVPELRAYVAEHFEQFRGSGRDKPGVEVYQFEATRLTGPTRTG